MKVWISGDQHKTRTTTGFRLHDLEPWWVDRTDYFGGGYWDSSMVVYLCGESVLDLFGKTTPKPGELLEMEVNPTTTWVME